MGDPERIQRANVQEFTVRAAGVAHSNTDYSLGKFPPKSKPFSSKSTNYRAQRQAHVDNKKITNSKSVGQTSWELIDETDKPVYVSHPEGNITASQTGTSYFVLVKEGPYFTALPIKEWHDFRANNRSNVLSLEEAEFQMQNNTKTRLSASSNLGKLVAKAEAEGTEYIDGDDEGEDADSDEGRETKRQANLKSAASLASGDDTVPHVKKEAKAEQMEKGEDWEHEAEHADDDLEQGSEDESEMDLPLNQEKLYLDSDSEDDHGLSTSGQELNRILRKTHLDSEDEGSNTRDDDDEEDVDLDDMASKYMPKVEDGSSSLQKAKAMSSNSQTATSKRKANSSFDSNMTKKTKSAASVEVYNPPTPQEILQSLQAWGPVTTQELTARFKKRLQTKEERIAFTKNVKSVSKLEEKTVGCKYVVPK